MITAVSTLAACGGSNDPEVTEEPDTTTDGNTIDGNGTDNIVREPMTYENAIGFFEQERIGKKKTLFI